MATSNNLGLQLTNKGEYVDVEKQITENFSKIDTEFTANSGLKEDPLIQYIQDAGTKKNGFCYKDKNQDGIFKCFADYTGTSNDANHFYKFDNNELLGKLQNLVGYGQKSSVVVTSDNISTSIDPVFEIFNIGKFAIVSGRFMNTEASKPIYLRVEGKQPLGSTATLSSGTVASDFIGQGFRYIPSVSANTVLFTAIFH